VAGCGFVVGDVSKELPHGSILSRNRHPICGSIANYQAPGCIPIRRVRQRHLGVPNGREMAS
jgi:hypothetical protein